MNGLRILLVTSMLWCSTAATALPPQRYGPGRGLSTAAIATMPDGGQVLTAYGSPNAVVVVTAARGEVTAARSIPNAYVTFVAANGAGEIYAGIYDVSEPRDPQTRVLKLRRDLTPLWSRAIVDAKGVATVIRRGTVASDGGVVVTARDGEGSFVAALTGDGSVRWASRIKGEQLDSIRALRDGGFIAAGFHRSRGWLVKLSGRGVVEWQRQMTHGRLDAVAPARDGGFVCVGQTGAAQPVVVKVDRDGSIVWSKVVSASKGRVHAVTATGGGFAVVVLTFDERDTSIRHLSLAFLNDDGAVQWQRMLSPGGHSVGVVDYTGSDAMLVSTPAGLKFPVGLSTDFLPLLTIDAATGRSDCGWLGDGSLQFADVRVDMAPAEIATGQAILAMRDVRTALEMAPMQRSAEPCTPAPPRPASPVPPSKSVRFVTRTVHPETYVPLLKGKKFAELDELADKLRRERSPDPMEPHAGLAAFYRTLATFSDVEDEQRLELLRQWVAARPQSLAARITLVNARVRIIGRTEFVSLSSQREELRRILPAGPDAESDPYYWYLRVTLACHNREEDVRAIARRGLELHGDFRLVARTAGCLVRDHDAVVAWADEASKLMREKLGDATYMGLAHEFILTEKELAARFDWSRVKRGFDDVIRIAPRWLPSYHRYAWMAHRNRDHETAQRLFQRPELDWFDDAWEIWHGGRAYYEEAREWALMPKGYERPRYGPPLKEVPPVQQPPVPPPPAEPPPPDFTKWPHMVTDGRQLLPAAAPGAAAFFVGSSAVSVDAAGAAFTASAKPLAGMQPLTRLTTEPSSREPVYIVACRQGGGRCLQVVLEGKIISTNSNLERTRRTFQIGLRGELPANLDLTGAAVVDAQQRVFAVIIDRAMMGLTGFTHFFHAADLANVVTP